MIEVDPFVEANLVLITAVDDATTAFLALHEEFYAEGSTVTDVKLSRGVMTADRILDCLGGDELLSPDQIKATDIEVEYYNRKSTTESVMSLVGIGARASILNITDDVTEGRAPAPDYLESPSSYQRAVVEGVYQDSPTYLITVNRGIVTPIAAYEQFSETSINESDAHVNTRVRLLGSGGNIFQVKKEIMLHETTSAYEAAIMLGLTHEYHMAVCGFDIDGSAYSTLTALSVASLETKELDIFIEQVLLDRENLANANALRKMTGLDTPTIEHLERLLEKIRAAVG
jgi:hypothetical protein